MNILFLIGNGFDLNLGLNTRFIDVKNEYLSRSSKDPLIDEFKKVLSLDQENWSDFEKAMGLYTENFNKSNKHNYISQINSFKEVLIEKFEDEQSRINYLNNKEHIFTVFKESLTNFQKYFNDKSKQIIKKIVDPTYENRDFTYNFITFNYTNILDKCIETIQTKNSKFNFRTFFYQSSELTVNDVMGDILHIHGTLKENLILGVDNMDQIKSDELKQDNEFHWEIVKPKINEDLEENYDSNARLLILTSSIICVFGMSIGETDKTWWGKIFEWLKSNEERHLLIFYYDKSVDEKNPSTKIKHIKKIKDLFNDIIDKNNETDKEKCYNRIHIAKNFDDMFKFNILSEDKVATKI